jgi:hypothetical protein
MRSRSLEFAIEIYSAGGLTDRSCHSALLLCRFGRERFVICGCGFRESAPIVVQVYDLYILSSPHNYNPKELLDLLYQPAVRFLIRRNDYGCRHAISWLHVQQANALRAAAGFADGA